MSDDYDDGDGEGGGSSGHEVPFEDMTMGVLIAGKLGELDGLTRTGLGKLKLGVDALGKAKGLALELVPSGDLTDTGPGPDEECWGSFAIGLPVDSGGSDLPESFSRDNALAKLSAAQAIGAEVWKELAALLPEGRREGFLAEQVSLQLVPVGPLAYASVAFGEEGTEEDAGQGEYLCGQDMNQERHHGGVWGQRVASGEDPAEVDLSESAHQARVAAFPKGSYYLIARYD